MSQRYSIDGIRKFSAFSTTSRTTSSAPDGTPGCLAIGSAHDVAFFGLQGRYLLDVDTGNEVLWILDGAVRPGDVPRVIGGFGSQGHNAGNFTLLHGVDVDSNGNLYTSETVDGRRLQKFIPRGKVAPQDLETYMGSPHYQPFPRSDSDPPIATRNLIGLLTSFAVGPGGRWIIGCNRHGSRSGEWSYAYPCWITTRPRPDILISSEEQRFATRSARLGATY